MAKYTILKIVIASSSVDGKSQIPIFFFQNEEITDKL